MLGGLDADPPVDTGTRMVTVASLTPCELPELGPLVEYPIDDIPIRREPELGIMSLSKREARRHLS